MSLCSSISFLFNLARASINISAPLFLYSYLPAEFEFLSVTAGLERPISRNFENYQNDIVAEKVKTLPENI